ncbi:MAG: iron dicitrate transport regulator FecR, partial [Planctomycetota bacterium]
DEGTQYAVSLDSRAAEIHVFDGSVLWMPTAGEADTEERIEKGEARRYERGEPGRSRRIPFGQRQFVRRIERALRDAGGGELLAYDGFENLAGQLRRGRSGFGWAGGWEPAGRGRGPLGEVVEAPNDIVFGNDRTGRRLLSIKGGDHLRRQFEEPIELRSGTALYVSVLIGRRPSTEVGSASTQISLEPTSPSRRYQRRNSVSFGITSRGEPFLNNAGRIRESATELPDAGTCLFILKCSADAEDRIAGLRAYAPGSSVSIEEPSVWTEARLAAPGPQRLSSLRISADQSSDWQIDELKIGTSWSAVVGTVAEATRTQ